MIGRIRNIRFVRVVWLALLLGAASLSGSTLIGQSRTGTITGRLVTRDGKPALGVRVAAEDAQTGGAIVLSSIAQTDNNGRYRLEGLLPGSYRISAGPISESTYFPRTLAVVAGATITDIDFVFSGPIRVNVSGRVVRVLGTTVLADPVRLEGRGVTLNTIAGTDGTFEFATVPSGQYNIVLPNYPAPRFTLNVLDADVSGIELTPQLNVNVQGSVVTARGGLLPRLTISLTGVPVTRGGGTVTPPNISFATGDGAFKGAIAEGDYRVAVQSIPEGYRLVSLTSGTTDLRAAPLQVAGTAPPPLVVTLEISETATARPVRGHVMDIATISSESRVVLWGISPNIEMVETPVRADRSFEFPMVLPGEYGVFLTPLPAVLKDNAVTVRIPAGGLDDLRVSPQVSKSIAGRVVVEGDGPVPRLVLTVTRESSGTSRRDPSDPSTSIRLLVSNVDVLPRPDGSFALYLPEGSYRVRSQTSTVPPGYAIQSMSYGNANLFQEPLLVDRTDNPELRIMMSATPSVWSRVAGQVAGVGTTRDGLRVSLTGTPAFAVADVTVGSDGFFEFPKVPSGIYTVRLFAGTTNDNPLATTSVAVSGQALADIEMSVR